MNIRQGTLLNFFNKKTKDTETVCNLQNNESYSSVSRNSQMNYQNEVF